jgi:hypothetical protein
MSRSSRSRIAPSSSIKANSASSSEALPNSKPRRTHSSTALSITAVIAMGSIFLAASSVSANKPSESLRPSTSLECASLTKVLMAQIGVSPQALAAIGADDDQVRRIVLAARDLCDAQANDFDSAQANVEEAQQRVSNLSQRKQRGLASEEDRNLLATAQRDLGNALAARQVIIDEVQLVINGVLNESQRALLTNIIAARSIEVPVHYKVASRTDAQWMSLRDQLSEQRRTRPGQLPQVVPAISNDESNAELLVQQRGGEVASTWQAALAGR